MKLKLKQLSFLALSFNAFSIDINNLDVDQNVKQQIINSVEVSESLEVFEKSVQHSINHPNAIPHFEMVTVGIDASCDFRFLGVQAAIDSGATEVRVTNQVTYFENLFINKDHLIIRGGYENCKDARKNYRKKANKNTIINGSKKNIPVIKVNVNNPGKLRNVILDSLFITEGDADFSFAYGAGGISVFDSYINMSLNNTIVAKNSGVVGGVLIKDSTINFIISNSLINNNISSNTGGGINCSNSTNVIMHNNSGISYNRAIHPQGTGGGGVHLDRCKFIAFSNHKSGKTLGINYNQASLGGGLILNSNNILATLIGAEVCGLGKNNDKCIGSNNNPVNLIGNKATKRNGDVSLGGGAALHYPTAVLNIFNGYVANNSSVNLGGAISLWEGEFHTKRITQNCWDTDHCNYYFKNNANKGGMISSGDKAAFADISDTVIEGNQAIETGTVLYSETQSDFIISNSLIHHNGGNKGDFNNENVFVTKEGTILDIKHSTIADNYAKNSVFRSYDSAGDTRIESSIIHDESSGVVFSPNPGFVSSDCSLFHESRSVPRDINSIVEDPKFKDRVNMDYHLSANSPAIDYCAINNFVSQLDLDFQDKGWDNPAVIDNLGPYDIGVDEFHND